MLNELNPSVLGSDHNTDFNKFDLNSKTNKTSFLLFGVGILLPWNAILASMDFFKEQFPSYKPSFTLIVAVSAPMLIVQAIAFFAIHKIPQHIKVTAMFTINTLITFSLVLVPLYIQNE